MFKLVALAFALLGSEPAPLYGTYTYRDQFETATLCETLRVSPENLAAIDELKVALVEDPTSPFESVDEIEIKTECQPAE